MDDLSPSNIANGGASSSATAQEKDPVCGMNVNPATARFKASYHNKEYFFCCSGCLQKFQANPEKILLSPAKPMAS
jgi:P-type Cu+ transporter